MTPPIAIAFVGASVVLGALWMHSRRESIRLESRLEEALSNLDRLQRTFVRFAPHPLVERVIGSDDPLAGE